MPESVAVKQPSSRTRLLQMASEELTKNQNTDEGLKLLDLNITSIPPELIEMIKDNATKLSLQKNLLTQLPNYFIRMTNLRYLDLHQNQFTEFPSVLCSFDRLEILDISENSIRKLPLNIGNLVNLKVLSLKDNKFEYLPSSIAEMSNLRILEVSNNPLIQPSLSLINVLQNGQDDWITKLKSYISEHGKYLDSKIQEITEPVIERTQSISSDYVSSKAAKRMGFIVNKKNTYPSVASPEDDISPLQQVHEQQQLQTPPKSQLLPQELKPLQQQPPPQQAQQPPQPSSLVQRTHLQHTPQGQKLSHQHSLSQPDLIKQNMSPLGSAGTSTSSVNRVRAQTVQTRNDGRSNTDLSSLGNLLDDNREEMEQKIYFKRLSTLQEVNKPRDIVIIDVSKKLLHISKTLHHNLSELVNYCESKKVYARMIDMLSSCKELIDSFSALQKVDTDQKETTELIDKILYYIVNMLTMNKKVLHFVQENRLNFFANADISVTRSLYLNVYGSLMEFFNACRIMYPNLSQESDNTLKTRIPQQHDHLPFTQGGQQPPVLRIDTGIAQQLNTPQIQSAQQNPSQVSDERLLESVYSATSAAQIVFSQLTNAINATAMNNVASRSNGSTSGSEEPILLSESVTAKIKDLTSICVIAIESTKSLKSSLHAVSTSIPQQQDKLKFYKDTNLFLKSIINILNTTKSSINDLPVLNELRPSLALLTKLTKGVTIMLENSTFKSIYDNQQYSAIHEDYTTNNTMPPQSALASHPPPLSSIPSISAFPPFHQQQQLSNAQQQQQLNNIQASLPPVTTPLIAALGNAQLQLVLPNAMNNQIPPQPMSQNPFDVLFASNTSAEESS